MSVTINGTSGVTTPEIANSEGYTGDGLTIAAGAPAGAMTLDASGNLGLGVVPSAWAGFTGFDLNTYGGLHAFTNMTGLAGNAYFNSGWKYKQATLASRYELSGGAHAWYTAPSGTAGNPITFTQAMTLDASGNLLVGTTSALARLDVRRSDAGTVSFMWKNDTSANAVLALRQERSTGATSGTQIEFGVAGGVVVGSITSTGSTTAYNTSSDYRLKENVQPMTNALDKISALKPVTYNWKVDGSADRGFIAHELQEVIPQAVSGEKDAVDDEGNIMPQGVDYGKITPELVAAIQEQQAIITDLKARIEQLETK